RTYQGSVKAGGLSRDRFAELILFTGADHPELFYVDYKRVEIISGPGGPHTWRIGYLYPKKLAKSESAALEKRTQALLSLPGAPFKGADALVICRWVHDLLVKNVEYDDEALADSAAHPEAYTILGALKSKRAVCQGIALTVSYLGERLGVDMPMIQGKGLSAIPAMSSDHGHAWNLAKADSGYVHLDVTWDLCISKPLHFLRYDYFCIDEADILRDHVITDALLPGRGGGESYFVRTGCDFTDFASCKDWLKSQMAAQKHTFYFRCRSKKESYGQLEQKLTRYVERKCPDMIPFGIQVEIQTQHNPEQGVFLYKLTKTGGNV
ncbi:MAG: hypothetical protein LUG56_04155, partial [Lachnospiraceae bacterium]|nr:hypothetical protein [Lachnospiraceae bacterium]